MNAGERDRPLARALGRIPSGLFILSARRQAGETGMLVSWVQQCAFEPPHVSVAIQRGRAIHDWLGDGTEFTLNILPQGQKDLVAHFGRGFLRGTTAFEGLEVDRSAAVGPVLAKALAFLDCRIVGRFPAGDHDLLIAEVTAGRLLADGEPLVHVRKNGFHY